MMICTIVLYAQDNLSYQYKPLIEQGKTWWYRTYRGNDDAEMSPNPIFFGLRIDGDTIIDNVIWQKLWYIHDDNSLVVNTPVQLIREENKRIDISRHEISGYQTAVETLRNNNNNDPYDYLILDKLVEWDFYRNHPLIPDSLLYNDYVTIYDFNTPESISLYWPWSHGEFCKFSDDNEYVYDVMGRNYKCYSCHFYPFLDKAHNDIKEPHRNPSQRQYGCLQNQLSVGMWDYKIIEGVGIGGDWANCGLFYQPTSDYSLITGYFNNIPHPPRLIFITDNHNNIIFRVFDNVTEPWLNSRTLKTTQEPYDNTVYDLYGRKINITIPGNIYIKDGKKHITIN